MHWMITNRYHSRHAGEGADPGQAPDVTHYYTGSGWSEEYPDAKLYHDYNIAKATARIYTLDHQSYAALVECENESDEIIKAYSCGYEVVPR